MEAPSKNRVFITGINGFTGIHLEKHLLEKGYDVYGTTFNKSNNLNHFPCDILDIEALSDIIKKVNPNYIVHLAAISFVASKNKRNIYDVNIFGTLNLLDAICKLDYTPNKILISSSAAVYGNIEGDLDESMCPQPVNHYGNSKLVMENMVKTYFEKQNIIITRPFNYTGIGQGVDFLIPKIVSHFKKRRKDIELGNINVYREFNNVGFVVRCYTEFLFSEVKSETLNVCSGKALCINDIIKTIEGIAGYRINVKINPKFVRTNEIKTLKGSIKKIEPLIESFIGDFSIDKTIRELYKE